MNNEVLFKPNGLILATADNTITATEYKIYDTLLQRCQITKDEQWRKSEISREDLKKIIKHNDNSTLAEIKSVLDKFIKINIKFKLGRKDVSANLIAEHIYDHDTDMFTCSLSENVFKALMRYNEIGYSPIDLKLVRQARGFYTQKIYGLLRMWSRQDESVTRIYTIEQIKDVCDIFEGTAYDVYGNFKKKVLNPAVKEINEKLNIKVTFKEIKVMRKVQSIEFTFIDHEPRRYSFDKDKLIEAKSISINNDEVAISIDEDIDSIEYMNLIDYKLNESIHTIFLKDFYDYKEYLKAVETASQKTLGALGGKTINKRNYKYFKATLENLIPSKEII